MKALRVLGPGEPAVVDLPEPDCAADEVVIRVEAVGVCGTDIEIIEGKMAYYTSGLAKYPITLGHEWVGRVARLGGDVAGFEVGDRVVGEVSIGCTTCSDCMSGAYHRCATRTETGVMARDGGLADFVVLPARAVHRISPTVDLKSAALVEPAAIAYNGVRLAGVTPASRVAIIGDGPIGLLLLQVAQAFGAKRCVMIGADAQRLEVADKLGAIATIDVRAGDLPGDLARAFRGEAPDVVLEASGNPDGVDTAIEIARAGATIVLQGLCGCRPPRGFDLDRIVVNDLTLRGALGSPGIWPAVIDLIETGQIDPSAIVTHDMPMSAFREALSVIHYRKSIKLILRPNA